MPATSIGCGLLQHLQAAAHHVPPTSERTAAISCSGVSSTSWPSLSTPTTCVSRAGQAQSVMQAHVVLDGTTLNCLVHSRRGGGGSSSSSSGPDAPRMHPHCMQRTAAGGQPCQAPLPHLHLLDGAVPRVRDGHLARLCGGGVADRDGDLAVVAGLPRAGVAVLVAHHILVLQLDLLPGGGARGGESAGCATAGVCVMRACSEMLWQLWGAHACCGARGGWRGSAITSR